MPELPDVEGFRRRLVGQAKGRRVERVEVLDPGVVRNVSGPALHRALRGCRFRAPDRHGKWLLAHTSGPTVVFHFGMSGSLEPARRGAERHPHDRVIFHLDRGELRYRDQRKLQGIWLAPEPGDIQTITGTQGPDALGLTRGQLEERLEGRQGSLKAKLMDQAIVAGLGNLLTDEILWQARLHPSASPDRLEGDDWRRLHTSMRRVLRASVRAGCVPPKPSWLTRARDRDGDDCPRCGTGLRRTRTGGRTSLWCPSCQRR